MPADAVSYVISQMEASGAAYDPQAMNLLRESLMTMFGLSGSPWDQYLRFLKGIITLDFGPSVIAFPTPAKDLVMIRLPYTVALLLVAIVIAWIVGVFLGIVSVITEGKRLSKILQTVSLAIYPVPYYIMALVLILVLAYIIPLFPIVSTIPKITSLEDIVEAMRAVAMPAMAIVLVNALGGWFYSSRLLALNVVTESFYEYAVYRGVKRGILIRRYILRNVSLPMITSLALSLGLIFSGALITETIFTYPGLGTLLYTAIANGDISTALTILTLTIYSVAGATLILDLIYPLIDPRVRYR
ncbi:MAG: ABC transporter permease [Sulfolobales archaeon]